MSGHTVLIVDDNVELRKLIRLSLEGEGYALHEAATGDECLELVRAIGPQLVILDVMMPGALNGLDVCAALRRDLDGGKIRIVMLTARGQARDRACGAEAGADAYLVKPFSPAELAATVKSLLSH